MHDIKFHLKIHEEKTKRTQAKMMRTSSAPKLPAFRVVLPYILPATASVVNNCKQNANGTIPCLRSGSTEFSGGHKATAERGILKDVIVVSSGMVELPCVIKKLSLLILTPEQECRCGIGRKSNER
jgi:hypothetical protein